MSPLRARVVGVALACIALAAPVAVHADEAEPGLSPSEARDAMHLYFRGERRGGAMLVAAGLGGVAIGGGLLAQDGAVGRGVAYPLLAVGAVEVIGGLIFYLAAEPRVRRLDAGFANRPEATRQSELRRIRGVSTQLTLLKITEVVLIAGGAAMAAAGAGTRNDTLAGVGLGVAIESTGLFFYDLFAGARALRYTRSLERMQLSAHPHLAPTGGALSIDGASLALLGSF